MPSSKRKSLAEQLLDLDNPQPKDWDPEAEIGFGIETYDENFSDSDDDEEESKFRKNYVSVGSSKLLKSQEIELEDPKYRGKKASRTALYDDQSESDNEDLGDNSDLFMNNNKSNPQDDWDEESNVQFSDNSDEGQKFDGTSDSEKEESDYDEESEKVNEQLQKIEEEEKKLVQTITRSSQADIEKGNHVKSQLELWTTCLDMRMKIHKALNSANKLPQHQSYQKFIEEDIELTEVQESINKTNDHIVSLISGLLSLRHHLCKDINACDVSKLKRKRNSTTFSDIWEDINSLEASYAPHQEKILEKWHNKVQALTGAPMEKKFKAINQNVNAQIQQVLHDKERLLKRTQLNRSEVIPIDKALNPEGVGAEEYDSELFDDGDFYQALLREYIDSQVIDSEDPIALSMKVAALNSSKKKKKKDVDSKATKGRKLRYELHEKLSNFMVPVPSQRWHTEMIDRLYSSLFGKLRQLKSEETSLPSTSRDENILKGEDGLVLVK